MENNISNNNNKNNKKFNWVDKYLHFFLTHRGKQESWKLIYWNHRARAFLFLFCLLNEEKAFKSQKSKIQKKQSYIRSSLTSVHDDDAWKFKC